MQNVEPICCPVCPSAQLWPSPCCFPTASLYATTSTSSTQITNVREYSASISASGRRGLGTGSGQPSARCSAQLSLMAAASSFFKLSSSIALQVTCMTVQVHSCHAPNQCTKKRHDMHAGKGGSTLACMAAVIPKCHRGERRTFASGQKPTISSSPSSWVTATCRLVTCSCTMLLWCYLRWCNDCPVHCMASLEGCDEHLILVGEHVAGDECPATR